MSQHFYASEGATLGNARGSAYHCDLPGGCGRGYPVAGDEGGHLGGFHALSTTLLAVIASTFGSFARLCRVASSHVPWTRALPFPCGRLPLFCVPVRRSNLVRLDIYPDLGNLRKGARDY